MRRTLALLGSALFLVLAQGTVAGLVPWWISRRAPASPGLTMPPLQFLGVLLAIAGLLVLLDAFVRFAWQGLGTPAPVFPTVT